MSEILKRGNGKEYTAESFESHEGLDGIRTRPTVYIGFIGKEGVYRLFIEGISNAIDEFSAGRLNDFDVTIDSSGDTHFIVSDHALGIPIEVFHDSLTKVHTGGKFGKSTYDFSSGLNGIGLKAINALSKKFIVDTVYRGKHGHFESEKSIEKVFWIKDDNKMPTGTKVEWVPDREVLEEISVDYGRYSNTIEMYTYINAGLKINLIWDGKLHTYYHPDGLLDYFSNIVVKKNKYHMISQPITSISGQEIPHPIKPNTTIRMNYSVYLSWAENGHGEYIESFVNGLRTINGGSHVTGTHMAITKAIKDYINKNNMIPKNAKFDIDGNDVRDTLVLIISANHSMPHYTTQIKDAMDNSDIQYFISSSLYPVIQNWLSDHNKEADNICKVVIRSAKARQAAKDAKDNIIKSNTKLSIGSIDPDKYSGCRSRDPDKCELFIVEGDSAKGSGKNARNTEYQAIFAVRGKGQNVFKTNDPKLSDENAMLAEILGCGIGPTFNINKLRFHHIVLAADADNDGANIRLLLTGFFFKYYLPIIEAGYLYEAIPPLFQIKVGKGKSAKDIFLPDQKAFDLAVSYTASQLFDIETIRGIKLSKDLSSRYTKSLEGYKTFIELYSTQTGINSELLEYIVRYYKDICSHKFKKLQLLDYECRVMNESDSFMHLNIDKGYEHYFVVLDDMFYKNIYLPIAKRLSEIRLMDVRFVGKTTGQRYGGSTYRNAQFIEGLLINKNSEVRRLKGLGESDASELRYYMFNPNTRNIRRVTMKDVEETRKVMQMTLGNNIEERKRFVMNGNSIY